MMNQKRILKKELELHSKNVNKYIIFHDTTTFANVDDIGGYYNNTNPDLYSQKTDLYIGFYFFL